MQRYSTQIIFFFAFCGLIALLVFLQTHTASEEIAEIDAVQKPIAEIAVEHEQVAELRTVTMAEVSTKNSETNCYTVIDGYVYDITAYLDQHTPGKKSILKACGIDATEMFHRVGPHNGVKATDALASLKIGALAE